MNFVEAEQRYRTLKQQYDAGSLSSEEFDNALRELMVQDEQGRWWALSRESGDWNYYDASRAEWVSAQPPIGQARPSAPPPPGVRPGPQPVSAHAQSPLGAPYPSGGYPTSPAGTTGSVSPGLKVVFYILSFLVPIVGIVLFFVYRNNPSEEDRKMAQTLLILGLVSFALSCICSFVVFAAGGGGYYY